MTEKEDFERRGEHWAGHQWPPTELHEVRLTDSGPVVFRFVNVRETSSRCLIGEDKSGGRFVTVVGSTEWRRVHPSFAAALQYVSSTYLAKATELATLGYEYSAMAEAVAKDGGAA